MATFKRKTYSSLDLIPEFEMAVSDFLTNCASHHTPIHLQNIRRRCVLFLKCMQSWGKNKLNDITYEDIKKYDDELGHLKKMSRIIEESSLHQFLKYLADNGQINVGRYLYMYLIELNCITRVEDLAYEEQQQINNLESSFSEFPPNEFYEASLEFVNILLKKGYNKDYVKDIERVLLVLYLFLDLNSLGYNPDLAIIWLNSDAAKSVFHGNALIAARRVLNVFKDYCESGEINFRKVYRKDISGIDELPAWCRIPLLNFVDQRTKEKLDEKTVKNDIYSLLRFCRFILHEGLQSYVGLTGELIHKFNIMDKHKSPEGKNACNNRVKRFLKYLYREGLVELPGLHYALGTAAVSVETIVHTLCENEIDTARIFVESASTALELRDSAIFLLGSDMGIRGSDIVSLKLSDIDWKKQSIKFNQNKTGSEVWLSMPTSVGNAIYRYLKYGRSRLSTSDYLFVSIHAPFEQMTRSICYSTLKRILPDRDVSGSGFHVTRKSFSSNRLNNGVCPGRIADAIGHLGTASLTSYLSLDKDKMSECPLSLRSLNISVNGGF
ncbi:MAG: tyrosine-type recombinase/integrase [Lachnospiraceae bacterium]|nr:tyrosine-type recombinase/integrase [Lachnospiraceae bacterium]